MTGAPPLARGAGMNRFFAALLLVAAPVPLLAQSSSQAQLEAIAGDLRDSALQDDYAWDIAEGLTTEVGPRLAGRRA